MTVAVAERLCSSDFTDRERVKLVQDFDRFCDDVLSEVRNILDNFEVDEDIVYVPQTVKRLREAS